MGAKTALLAFADGDIRPALLGASRSERSETEALVRRVHPGYVVEAVDDGSLFEDVYPPDDITYATKLAGVELYCDRRLVLERPSELPEHLRRAERAGGSSCTGCTRSWTGSVSRSGRTASSSGR